MSERSLFFDLEQDARIWDGLSILARLPTWLLAACDPDRVCEELSHVVPQFSETRLSPRNCAVEHIRYKDGHWNGFYRLMTEIPGGHDSRTVDLEGDIYPPGIIPPGEVQVSGDLGTDGWQAVIPALNLKLKAKEAEKALASLAFLTDPEQSRQYLTRIIRSGSPQYADLKIQASRPNVVRYKPGSRCTIIYQLEYASNGSFAHPWPARVVAKTYRGVKGKNAYDSMVALWNSSLRQSGMVNIAEPLAYAEQERVMIQGAIPEEDRLKNFIHSAFQSQAPEMLSALNTLIEKTAAGLAELHRSAIDLGPAWTWEDELAEIQERVDSLSTAYPELAQAAEPLLKRLSKLAAAYPPDPAVPSHGSFRPSQVLLDRDRVGFIDFDTFCQSEPANDLALFLSTVMVNSLTDADSNDEDQENQADSQEQPRDVETRAARLALAAATCEHFLAAYEQRHPVSRQRVALWETLDILMLVLHDWIKVKPRALAEIHSLLERFLQAEHIVSASRKA